ncbi:MAG: prepilin-type N-terminal cleavage/methylation domain-containing protein [Candidatus Hydrogenedentes bacterium]|nr:prepilin-type N-terminal cleavage/methylation domain-containing protein [Candidatus Hydrogenedentota bacterium]
MKCIRRQTAAYTTAGFTLLELMVVLMLIAMLSTFIVPSITSSAREKGLDAVSGRLRELADFSYMTAVTRQRPTVLNVDPRRGRCWVTTAAVSLPWLETPQEERPPSRVLASMAVPEGIRIDVQYGERASFERTSSREWDTITFRSDGQADDVAILLENEAGQRVEIAIQGVTGETRLEEDVW